MKRDCVAGEEAGSCLQSVLCWVSCLCELFGSPEGRERLQPRLGCLCVLHEDFMVVMTAQRKTQTKPSLQFCSLSPVLQCFSMLTVDLMEELALSFT